jgi:hypothetical protein
MNKGTQGCRLKKKTQGRKSRETVPLNNVASTFFGKISFLQFDLNFVSA